VLLVHGSRSMTPASSAAADDRGAPSLPGTYAVTVKRTFPGSPDQVARVREFVRLVLGPVPVVDEAVLLTSELQGLNSGVCVLDHARRACVSAPCGGSTPGCMRSQMVVA
jgi:hypothetical protein